MKLVANLHENVLFDVEKITEDAKVNICHQERNFFFEGFENTSQNEKTRKKKRF
jgi:hypothetical protein